MVGVIGNTCISAAVFVLPLLSSTSLIEFTWFVSEESMAELSSVAIYLSSSFVVTAETTSNEAKTKKRPITVIITVFA